MSWSIQLLTVYFLSVLVSAGPAAAQAASRDVIGNWLQANRAPPTHLAQSVDRNKTSDQANKERKDPRSGDKTYEQAKRLMQAIDAILADAAKQRTASHKLPSKNEFILTPLWTETKEDREQRIQELLDAALGVVTDVPVVDVQKRIEQRRKAIRELEDQIVDLREKQLSAPQDSLLPGVISDTVSSLGERIADAEKRIAKNNEDIEAAKAEIRSALSKSGIKLSKEQVDLLLGGVLSGDLVRLVAVFDSAKLIDQQLAQRMAATGENMKAARKYFAMHAALFAMLVHAQDSVIAKIDRQYLPKLDAISKDLRAARRRTKKLLRGPNRPDQKRILESNLRSQALAEKAARGYRRYLLQQREQVAQARRRAARDLSIADNTYETVEASFQLRNLMRNTKSTFEALQKLESPTFEQIFKNEELRREFENLTKKLEAPSS
ncbi:MAG: hypothetical protein ACR2OV_04540 [Hyphomicrobiaceae bacterium]